MLTPESKMELKNIDKINISDREKGILENFAAHMGLILGDELESIVLYGSVVKNNYFPGSSDINVLVLVPSFNAEVLRKIAPVIKRYENRDKVSTYLADMDDIRDSADVFPIRYLDMKKHHVLLFGHDIFEGMEIHQKNLRYDLERQLRNIVLTLRQMYIHSSYTAGELRNILVSNFSTLSYLLSALLHIKGIDPPAVKEEIIVEAAKAFNLDLDVLSRILTLKRGGNNPLKEFMQVLFDDYLEIVDQFAEIVDKMKI